MRYKIQVYNIWNPGQRKDSKGEPHQEDSLYPAFNQSTDADRLFILCDGMGGHDAGEVASATVCEAMSDTIINTVHDPEGPFDIQVLNKAIDNAFNALDEKDTGAMKKMGTTMTMLKLYDHGALVAHMGDSRVYHIRPGKTAAETKVLYRTWDHSLVFDLIKAGIITEAEAKFSPQKNVITRAMQPHNENRPEATFKKIRDIKPGDYFYLCSDGMLEQMDIPELCQIFSQEGGNDKKKVATLIKETEHNKDNHTAIIVHILDVIDPLKDGEDLDEFDANYSDTFDGILPPAFDSESFTAEATQPTEKETTDPNFKNRNKKKKKALVFGIILAILAAICLAAWILIPRDAGDDAPASTGNDSEGEEYQWVQPTKPERPNAVEKAQPEADTPAPSAGSAQPDASADKNAIKNATSKDADKPAPGTDVQKTTQTAPTTLKKPEKQK